jgi:hypothetical protein
MWKTDVKVNCAKKQRTKLRVNIFWVVISCCFYLLDFSIISFIKIFPTPYLHQSLSYINFFEILNGWTNCRITLSEERLRSFFPYFPIHHPSILKNSSFILFETESSKSLSFWVLVFFWDDQRKLRKKKPKSVFQDRPREAHPSLTWSQKYPHSLLKAGIYERSLFYSAKEFSFPNGGCFLWGYLRVSFLDT